ncbi:hypothetical protein [Glycomyces arizonensis]|uniref:hypothetical protein n=1 Tax=Glycomyces arizonensis TaxID=256035 RepID=UPI001B7FA154|nr:hypothetical protein [Glycomyces arizonensis]
MTYPPPGGNPPPPGYGQQPQQPGYPSQQGGPVPQQPGYPPQQPGYGQQQPGYPPPPQPGGYGAPPPPMPPAGNKGGGATAKILGAVGTVVVIGIVIALRVFLGGDSSDDTDPNNDTLNDDQVEAAEAAEVGDCMADALSSETDDLVVPCDDPNAFWTITAVSNDSGAEVDMSGELTDTQAVIDLCGEEVMGWELGQLWKSYQYVYTESVEGLGGPVDHLYCVEAIEKADDQGRMPITPDVGLCFDDSTDGWWSVSCDDPNAVYEVINSEVVSPPVEMTQEESDAELGGCPDANYYPWPVTGVEGKVWGILCVIDH